VNTSRDSLFHYTNENGYNGISKSRVIYSCRREHPKHITGQYFTDIEPSQIVCFTYAQKSASQINDPTLYSLDEVSFNLMGGAFSIYRKFEYFLEIDVSKLTIIDCGNFCPDDIHIFVYENDLDLDVRDLIIDHGKTPLFS
jgi:hypothetical protein